MNNGSSVRRLSCSQRSISTFSFLHLSHIGLYDPFSLVRAGLALVFSVSYDFEEAEVPTARIENGNRLTGVFDKFYRELDRLFAVREIVYDQRNPGFVSDPCVVKLLPHGFKSGGASHRFVFATASA